MANLTKEDIEKFKSLWLKKYGEKLTDEQAQAEASRLIRQFSYFCAMIPEHS